MNRGEIGLSFTPQASSLFSKQNRCPRTLLAVRLETEQCSRWSPPGVTFAPVCLAPDGTSECPAVPLKGSFSTFFF